MKEEYLDSGESKIHDYTKAIELSENPLEEYYNNRGVAYEAIDNFKLALEDYKLALELHPNEKTALSNIGDLYLKQDLYQEAIDYYSRALAIDSYYVYCDWKKAICFVKMRRHEEAILEYSRCIELEPENEEYYIGRALVYTNIGLKKLAKADLKKALKINPNNKEARKNMSELSFIERIMFKFKPIK